MVINAKPLLAVCLDVQIKRHGGEGYNTKVKSYFVENTFSVMYEFETPEGYKKLLTQNSYQLGTVDTNDGLVHIVLNADTHQYTLVRVSSDKNVIGEKELSITVIGTTLDEALTSLKECFPNQLSWKLSIPSM